MKILYIPLKTSTKETDGFYKSLKRKFEVRWFWDFGDPGPFDIIHLQSGAITVSELKQIKAKNPDIITQWTGDYRPEPLKMVTQYKGLVDITFMAADVPELYPDLDVRWLPHGVDDWQFREVKEGTEGILMVANDYPQFPGGVERRDLIKLLGDKLTVAGFDWQLDWYEAPSVYNNYKFAIGPNIYNDAKWYFSTRPLNAMAAGTCYLMRWIPGIEDFFEHGKDCLIYKENEEVLDLIKIDDKTRNQIARNGQEKVRKLFHYNKIAERYENELKRKTSIKVNS